LEGFKQHYVSFRLKMYDVHAAGNFVNLNLLAPVLKALLNFSFGFSYYTETIH
jgi:hypothetical protein